MILSKLRVLSIFGVSFSLASMPVFSECYVASEFSGASTRQGGKFKLSEDAFSGKTFELNIDGDKSSVSSSELTCLSVASATLLCVDYGAETKVVIETWAVYVDDGIVVHTKTVNGYGKYNGAQVFVGALQGLCHQ